MMVSVMWTLDLYFLKLMSDFQKAGWDADFATKAYRQHVEALAQQQVSQWIVLMLLCSQFQSGLSFKHVLVHLQLLEEQESEAQDTDKSEAIRYEVIKFRFQTADNYSFFL